MKEDLKPVPMFADRETLKEAFDYATEVIDKSTTCLLYTSPSPRD